MNLKLYSSLLLLFFCFGTLRSQTHLWPVFFQSELVQTNTSKLCNQFSINAGISHDHLVDAENMVDLACLDKSYFDFKIETSQRTACKNDKCRFKAEIYLCNHFIRSFSFSPAQSLEMQKLNFNQVFVDVIHENALASGTCSVQINVLEFCGTSWHLAQTHHTDIQIINSERAEDAFYFKNILVNEERFYGIDGSFILDTIVSCNCADEYQKKIIPQQVKGALSQMPNQDYIDYKLHYSFMPLYNQAQDLSTYLVDANKITHKINIRWKANRFKPFDWNRKLSLHEAWLVKSPSGKCAHPQYYIMMQNWKTVKMKANCNGEHQVIGTVHQWSEPKVETDLTLKIYPTQNLDSNFDCKSIPVVSDENLFNIKYTADCKVNISINDVSKVGLDPNTTRVIWKNSDQNIIKGNELKNVDFGKYTLELKDDCCNTYIKTIYTCENLSFNPWYPYFGDKYCRQVTCGSGCSFQECVTSDETRYKFDPLTLKCVKEYYYKNELLEAISSEPRVETDWDDIWDRCESNYFCDGNVSFTDKYDPERESWEYNDFWEECQLSVTCRGQELSDVQEIDADIVWEWDDFWEECESVQILCDGQFVFGDASRDPDYLGDWEFSTNCNRQIICEFGGGTLYQTEFPDFESTDEQGRCSFGETEWTVVCDGEDVDYVCLSNLVKMTGSRSKLKKDKHVHIYQKESTLIINVSSVGLTHYEIHMYDMMGRKLENAQVSSPNETVFLDLAPLPKGMYLVTLVNGTQIIHHQKVILAY